MEIHENMYYGIGKVVLAIAKADGTVSSTEIGALKTFVLDTEKELSVDLSLVYISFEYFRKYDNMKISDLLEEGIHNFHLGDDHLTPKLAKAFKTLLVKVAEAQPPITVDEDVILTKFIDYLEMREEAQFRAQS